MAKRIRALSIKDNELRAGWGKEPYEEPDICVTHGFGCNRVDSSLLLSALCNPRNRFMSDKQDPSLVEELIKRGYDIETLRFSIKKKTV